eukprot:TRINITY_DN106295_c0_g1_i1.p1 TRINITY_DN106295_c0_g1~~TRINITY_DN106295_c0_g1_i1.p1  ORF type:complete len:185 (-),score=44.58 TRINITY_DN106295_c0_g1_i1:37-591(-)
MHHSRMLLHVLAWLGLRLLATAQETMTTSEPFDCKAGAANWRNGWSEKKKDFCCQHFPPIGCEEFSAPTPPGDAAGAAASTAAAAAKTEPPAAPPPAPPVLPGDSGRSLSAGSSEAAAAAAPKVQKGCCDCNKKSRNGCKDGKSNLVRKRNFCTDQTSPEDCANAGGVHWVGAGTCRWHCRTEL